MLPTDASPPRLPSLFVFALAVSASLWGNAVAWSRPDELSIAHNPVILAAGAVAIAGAPLLLLAALRLWREGPAAGALLRWSLVFAVGIWLAYLAATGRYYRGRVGLFAAVWAALVALLLWRLPAQKRKVRRIEILAVSSCVSLVFGELLLSGAAAVMPSPLLLRSTSSSAQRLEANAFPPGYLHFGFPTNALGFYDAEFAPASPQRQRVVAVIGDSFSASLVPHAVHYTTVAEKLLPGTEVWNIGWPALSPAEYLVLLQKQVMPLEPDAIVISLFLGNDLAETLPWNAFDRALARWFDRGNVLLFELPRRLLAISHDVRHAEPGQSGSDGLAAEPPWLHDPMQEQPSCTADAYLRLETERAVTACRIDAAQWDALTGQLQALRRAVGTRPFGFLLIPDEFMVEDDLWRRVQQQVGGDLDRLALRDRIVAWCRDHSIPCFDLQPALTAMPPLADGDRHLYRRCDTHWNARGNAVGGQGLAAFVRELCPVGK